MENWHGMDVKKVFDHLGVDPQRGLSDAEAAGRLEQVGPNELVEKGVKAPWKILWEQLTGIMVVILIVSAVISLLLAEYVDAIAILVIVILNAALGFTQEYRAEKAMAALKKMAVPHVRVRREGHIREVSARNLVPGDVIILEAGNAVPADCRLIEAANLRAQESVLTGESEPVEKHARALEPPDLPVADRRNMLYLGTVITYGRGEAVVTTTGMNTQLGHIAEMIQSVGGEPTPLQRRLNQLGKGLAAAALGIVGIVFLLGVLRGEDVRLMILTSISMAVAAVPEGLPAVVTIALALGAQRMLQRRALIRKLPAVETLGSVTVICSDKTGTLTENRMTVTVLDVAGNQVDLKEAVQNYSPTVNPEDPVDPAMLDHPAVGMLLLGGALCNDALLEKSEGMDERYVSVGDPTEGALIIAAAHAGLWKSDLEGSYPRVNELPFDSERKRMTTVHRMDPENGPDERMAKLLAPFNDCDYLAFTKGAVDGLLDISSHVWVDGTAESLTEDWRQRILNANDQLANRGMRVLGVSYRRYTAQDAPVETEPEEAGLTFVGLVGMIDPARPEVAEAVRTTRQAGIRPMMITGDHPLTALHIAQELGITTNSEILVGQDLAKMSVEEIQDRVDGTSVFARVSPEHKLKIVQALQNKGQLVAMTGDGVNDAPALKKADIGVAMGITGTDVSKEAADMVLLDDNYATIVAAVEEGRRIYDNIRKFIKYTMTSNAGEIWVMLLAPFLGMPLPLLPLQILWVNLVTDGLPGLALTVEPAEKNTMHRPPYPPNESVFGRGMVRDILWIGLLMGFISLGMGYWAWQSGIENWRSMVFTTLTLSQMGNAMAIRSDRESLFRIGLLSNKMMLGSVLLTFILQLAVLYIPFLQAVFKTEALSGFELGVSLIFSSLVFLAVEGFKAWRRNL